MACTRLAPPLLPAEAVGGVACTRSTPPLLPAEAVGGVACTHMAPALLPAEAVVHDANVIRITDGQSLHLRVETLRECLQFRQRLP